MSRLNRLIKRLDDVEKSLEPESFFIITNYENYEAEIAKYTEAQLKKAHIIVIRAVGHDEVIA